MLHHPDEEQVSATADRPFAAAVQCRTAARPAARGTPDRGERFLRPQPTSGDPWAPGAIGYARWTGVALADVLHAAGSEADPSLHVAFACADGIEMGDSRFRYGASVPMEKALHPDVLLAWQMNGQDLRPEHGFPLRVVVPGYAGVPVSVA